MKIREFDDLVNWVKSNVLDFPQASNESGIRSLENNASAAHGRYADPKNLKRARLDVNAPTEYEYSDRLFEHIIGLDG